ncbi:hypothetical protein ACVWXO_010016 [Bradyrhizobium sp. LM2.7]
MNFGILVGVGDFRQHRRPHHHRQLEAVKDVDRGDRGRGAVMRHRGDDRAVGGDLGDDLDADVRLAFVVEHNQLVVVFGLRVGIHQFHGQFGRVAAADAVGGECAGERPDERDLDLVLGKSCVKAAKSEWQQARCGKCGESSLGNRHHR